jgi:hypothetical protein
MVRIKQEGHYFETKPTVNIYRLKQNVMFINSVGVTGKFSQGNVS